MVKKAIPQGRSEQGGNAYSHPHLEPLSESRPPLADFFIILLAPPPAESRESGCVTLGSDNREVRRSDCRIAEQGHKDHGRSRSIPISIIRERPRRRVVDEVVIRVQRDRPGP